jgi:hypothetical protein
MSRKTKDHDAPETSKAEPTKVPQPPAEETKASSDGRPGDAEASGLVDARGELLDVLGQAPGADPAELDLAPLDQDVADAIDTAERLFHERQAKKADEAPAPAPKPAAAPAVNAPPGWPTQVEAAIGAAAKLVDVLATKCASGGAAGLGELRQLERDIRALAPL